MTTLPSKEWTTSMNRLKLLGAIALLGIPLAACDEGTEPPPVGSIVGQVSIEGTGIDGISVNLSNGNSTTTSGGGNYRFDAVDGGAYTVTISGYPSDATFDATSAAATISSAGQSVTINFSGSYIRTASIMGSVTVENMGLGGVTVALSGVSSASTVTDDNGQYAFTGLRQGSYSVEISGFDSDEVGFSNTAAAVTVDVGESKIQSFDGTYLRTAGIQGQVSVEGVGLEGVNVSLRGGPDGADMTTTTDAAGLYSFARLRAGDYAVGISGFDTDEYEFAVTSQNVTVALGETATLPFEGILLRTSGIAGRVSVGGMGIEGVTVTVSAEGMDDVTAMTDATGQYAVSALAAGDYTVTISGYDAVEYSFTDSQDVTLVMDQTAIVNFEGMSLRTANIAVSVTADGEGVAGAGVTVTMITGATSGTVVGTQATDADGAAAFGNLLAGNYLVGIAVDSDEIDFESTDATVAVATGATAEVSFEGAINRTASISGSVTVDGEGMGGVAVMLSGGEGDQSAETGDDGSYSFTGLRKGDYTVSITNPDEARYEFSSTSESVSLAVGQEQSVSFAGSMTRSSTISGTVSVEGSGIGGVTVTLSAMGMDDMTDETDDAGGYAFTGLGAGDYTVAITLSDDQEAAYNFETTSMEVSVGDNDVGTANFDGTHDASATISGMLFVDEAAKNDSYDDGEHPFPAPGVPVVLVGPDVGDRVDDIVTDETGAFSFTDLKAGTYQLVVPITPEVAMALGDYAYGGPATGYEIELGVGATHMQAIPFDITHQTVNFSVWMKRGDETGPALPGATVTFYADVAGKDMVASGETGDDGHTSIRFARSEATGNTVYAGIAAPEGPYAVGGDMQAVMWDPQYPMMPEVVTNTADVVNLQADVTFAGRTIETAAGGGKPLSEWAITVMMMNDDGDMVAVEGDDVPEALGEEDAADDGMASFMSTAASADDLPMTYYFGIVGHEDQSDSRDNGQEFMVTPMPSDYAMADGAMLAYEHDGLSLAGNMDLGALEVKYTTQELVVWAHQERDQVAGYTTTISGGDSRPWAGGIRSGSSSQPNYRRVPAISFELRHIDENGRSRPVPDYENRIKHPYTRYGTSSEGWAVFDKVPADLNIVVKASTDADRMIINNDEAQAWRDFEANKVMGSAFGEHGGFHHTVNLCPESADDPDQDYLIDDRCSTFAYVWTRDISGEAMSESVAMAENPLDGFEINTTYHSGIQVSLAPVDRKNVQADSYGATSRAENTNTSARELGTYSIANVGDGEYELGASGGFWDVTSGDKSYATDETGAVPPSPVTINVVPFRFDIYGTVTDADGVGVQDVEVTVGGQTVTTDDYGRYILADASPGRNRRITAAKVGYAVQTVNGNARTNHAIANGYSLQFTHWPNTPRMVDFGLRKVTPTGTVSGTIKHLQSDAPLEGVRVFALALDAVAPADLSEPGLLQIDRDANDDPVYTFDGVEFADVDTTDADGNFSVEAPAGALNGKTTTIVAYRSGMFFMPDKHITTVVDGGAYTLSFDGLRLSAIDGYIRDANGDGMEGVTVTAVGGTTGSAGVTREVETLASGRYNIRVPWGPYTVTPTKEAYSFDPASLSVTLAAEQVQTLQDFEVSADDNVLPAFSSPAAFDAAENQTAVGTVVAADADADDDVTGYAITGGADMAMLEIDAATGALTFKEAPDFEMPGDADEMNDYEVEVTATSGTGARERTAMQEITVTVTDVDDDVTPQVTLALAPTSISENGGVSVVTATVEPAAEAAFNVTVTAAGGGDNAAAAGDFTQSGSTLFFAAGATTATASATNVPVTITAVNNNAYTGDKTVMVSGAVTEASGVMAPEDAELTIMDDDEPNVVSLELSRTSIDEADDATTTDVTENASVLTAEIERPLAANLTVTVTVVGTGFDEAGGLTDDGDATTENTYTGTLTITAGETSSGEGTASEITITATADDTDAMDHTVMISGEAEPDDGLEGPDAVTLTIEDDDAAPDAIADLAATAPAPSAATTVDITLTWTDPTGFGTVNGTDATAATVTYQYRVKTSGQSNYGAWTGITPTDGTGANAGKRVGTVTRVTVDNTYNYQVRIVAPSGPEGPMSNTADVVVAPATGE